MQDACFHVYQSAVTNDQLNFAVTLSMSAPCLAYRSPVNRVDGNELAHI
jgi:hypothetical protein